MTIAGTGYSILTALVAFLVIWTYRNGLQRMGTQPSVVRKQLLVLILAFIGWFVYLYFIGKSGLLWSFSLPPRFPLCVFLPLLLTAVFILVRNRKSALYQVIPKSGVLYFQSFRVLVEWVILFTYFEGVFPVETTFEGYNFEIVTGLLAPVVAFGVYRKRWFSEKWALYFNYAGLVTLAIIIFIVMSSLYYPQFWGDTEPRIKAAFSEVPYLFLPGFLAPMAIFAHIFSIIQIRKSRLAN